MLCILRFDFFIVFIHSGDDGAGMVFWSCYLQEGVLVLDSLLALLTEIEVLADGTLVAGAHDGGDSAAVTLYSAVGHGVY